MDSGICSGGGDTSFLLPLLFLRLRPDVDLEEGSDPPLSDTSLLGGGGVDSGPSVSFSLWLRVRRLVGTGAATWLFFSGSTAFLDLFLVLMFRFDCRGGIEIQKRGDVL